MSVCGIETCIAFESKMVISDYKPSVSSSQLSNHAADSIAQKSKVLQPDAMFKYAFGDYLVVIQRKV